METNRTMTGWAVSEHENSLTVSTGYDGFGTQPKAVLYNCEPGVKENLFINGHTQDEYRQVAALMAAAPDLLAALKTLLWACRDGAVLPRDSAHAQAIAAIAKATPCSHNTMAENLLPNGTPDMDHPWKCANCGYVYQ